MPSCRKRRVAASWSGGVGSEGFAVASLRRDRLESSIGAPEAGFAVAEVPPIDLSKNALASARLSNRRDSDSRVSRFLIRTLPPWPLSSAYSRYSLPSRIIDWTMPDATPRWSSDSTSTRSLSYRNVVSTPSGFTSTRRPPLSTRWIVPPISDSPRSSGATRTRVPNHLLSSSTLAPSHGLPSSRTGAAVAAAARCPRTHSRAAASDPPTVLGSFTPVLASNISRQFLLAGSTICASLSASRSAIALLNRSTDFWGSGGRGAAAGFSGRVVPSMRIGRSVPLEMRRPCRPWAYAARFHVSTSSDETCTRGQSRMILSPPRTYSVHESSPAVTTLSATARNLPGRPRCSWRIRKNS